jgi:hypothetical protein
VRPTGHDQERLAVRRENEAVRDRPYLAVKGRGCGGGRRHRLGKRPDLADGSDRRQVLPDLG